MYLKVHGLSLQMDHAPAEYAFNAPALFIFVSAAARAMMFACRCHFSPSFIIRTPSEGELAKEGGRQGWKDRRGGWTDFYHVYTLPELKIVKSFSPNHL